MGVHAPSEEEYQERKQSSDFKLFPSDDYILEVKTVTVRPNQVDIYNKNADGTTRIYDDIEVRFRPISFANGDELTDEDGEDIPAERDPLIFDWLDPSKVGLKPVAARARKFFAAATGVELEDRIDIDDFQELVGKRVLATVIVKRKDNGDKNNRVTDYRRIRTRRGRPATPVETVTTPRTALPNMVVPEAVFEAGTGDLDDLPF